MPAATKRSRAPAPGKPRGSFSDDAAGREEEAFAARVAVHLREFASKRRKRLGGAAQEASADGWTAATADAAVRAAAAMLPRDSHVRARVEACLDAFVAKVVGTLTRAEGAGDGDGGLRGGFEGVRLAGRERARSRLDRARRRFRGDVPRALRARDAQASARRVLRRTTRSGGRHARDCVPRRGAARAPTPSPGARGERGGGGDRRRGDGAAVRRGRRPRQGAGAR